MRIVAGSLGSRKIKSLKTNQSRPTSEKIRSAIFDHLGSSFSEGSFLDLFSGTGAMSFEAISRGFDFAVLVEKDRKAFGIIKENIKDLNLEDSTKVLNMDAKRFLKTNHEKFDLIFMDPPYNYDEIEQLLVEIDKLEILREKGYCIVETDKNVNLADNLSTLHKYQLKKYGNTLIHYYIKG